MNRESRQSSFRNIIVKVAIALMVAVGIAALMLVQNVSGVARSEQANITNFVVKVQPVPVPAPVPAAATPVPEAIIEATAPQTGAAPQTGTNPAAAPVAIRAPEPTLQSAATPAPGQFEQPAGNDGTTTGGPFSLAVIIIWLLVTGATAIMVVNSRRKPGQPQSGRGSFPAFVR